MEKLKNIVLGGLSVAGSLLLRALGGWDGTLFALMAFMGMDYLTGLVLAGVFKRSPKTEGGAIESRAGFKGLVRKCCILLLVFLGVVLDRMLGTVIVRPAVCLFFTANEGISILENLGLMGVPYPKFLSDMLERLRQSGDSGENIKKGDVK